MSCLSFPRPNEVDHYNDFKCEKHSCYSNTYYYLVDIYKHKIAFKICNYCRDDYDSIKSSSSNKNILDLSYSSLFNRKFYKNYIFNEVSKEEYENFWLENVSNEIDCNKLSDKVVDFCKKWNVSIEFQCEDKYKNTFSNCLNSQMMGYIEKLKNNTELNIFENPFYYLGINISERKIIIKYTSEAIHKSGNKYYDINFLVLHELTHILMGIIPYEVDEFSSPFYALNLMILWNLKAANNFTSNLSKMNSILEYGRRDRSDIKLNKFDEYIAYHSKSLINSGLLTKDLEFTFNSDNVVPEKHWYYLPEMFEFRHGEASKDINLSRYNGSYKGSFTNKK